jgi:hypothetical protein
MLRIWWSYTIHAAEEQFKQLKLECVVWAVTCLYNDPSFKAETTVTSTNCGYAWILRLSSQKTIVLKSSGQPFLMPPYHVTGNFLYAECSHMASDLFAPPVRDLVDH